MKKVTKKPTKAVTKKVTKKPIKKATKFNKKSIDCYYNPIELSKSIYYNFHFIDECLKDKIITQTQHLHLSNKIYDMILKHFGSANSQRGEGIIIRFKPLINRLNEKAI